jgi:hypothetical protein
LVRGAARGIAISKPSASAPPALQVQGTSQLLDWNVTPYCIWRDLKQTTCGASRCPGSFGAWTQAQSIKTHTHPPSCAPRDLARSFHIVRFDDQREAVGYADRAFDFETGARVRYVAHEAINTGRPIEYNGARFERALSSATSVVRLHEEPNFAGGIPDNSITQTDNPSPDPLSPTAVTASLKSKLVSSGELSDG